VEQLTTLLAAPDVVMRVRATAERENHTATELAEEIGRDQGLSAKVLKLVNSGFFAFRQPITTITHALVLLGSDVVASLVVAAPVFDMFGPTGAASGLWTHSLATARCAGTIADVLGFEDPEELSLAGLLHDVGKVIIAREAPDAARLIRESVARDGGLVVDAERRLLHFDHADVGGWLLGHWGLPRRLVTPVARHHAFDPAGADAPRVAVVHVADVLARAAGRGDPGDAALPSIDPRAWALLGMTSKEAAAALAEIGALGTREAA
jgi:putative nucleotidyltransferase with HDIG domain